MAYLGWRADMLEVVLPIDQACDRKGGGLQVELDGSAVLIGCAGNALNVNSGLEFRETTKKVRATTFRG